MQEVKVRVPDGAVYLMHAIAKLVNQRSSEEWTEALSRAAAFDSPAEVLQYLGPAPFRMREKIRRIAGVAAEPASSAARAVAGLTGKPATHRPGGH